MSLASTFAEQLNSEHCSVIAGTFLGGVLTGKIIFYMVISYFIVKLVDKLAFEPLLNWISTKIKKKINYEQR